MGNCCPHKNLKSIATIPVNSSIINEIQPKKIIAQPVKKSVKFVNHFGKNTGSKDSPSEDWNKNEKNRRKEPKYFEINTYSSGTNIYESGENLRHDLYKDSEMASDMQTAAIEDFIRSRNGTKIIHSVSEDPPEDASKVQRITSISLTYSESENFQNQSDVSKKDSFEKGLNDSRSKEFPSSSFGSMKISEPSSIDEKNQQKEEDPNLSYSSESSSDLSPPPLHRSLECNSESSEEFVPNSIETVLANFKLSSISPDKNQSKHQRQNSCELPTYKKKFESESSFPENSASKRNTDLVVTYFEDGSKQINQYKLTKRLLSDSCYKTYLAIDKEFNQFIVKCYDKKLLQKKSMGNGKSALDKIIEEVNLALRLNHKYIQKLVEVIDSKTNGKLILVLEFASNGKFKRKMPIIEARARRYYRQLISALDYLHNEAFIAHLNIIPESVLVDTNENIKLTDFSLAQPIINGNDEACWIHKHELRAPEIKSSRRTFKGRAADVWGTGLCLYFWVNEKYPERQHKFDNDEQNDLTDLLSKLLEEDPERRISLNSIKTHPWLTCNGRNPLL
ncbi:unnamed protein product [Blepharisma stoltei]|uniref:Protein kinase domain-containing protein n=1 Tax=Blepharisma stoltei TaxID=1481888 RepID=A0AAU9I7M1_9CILI|nr:unnamed protein product [Blepharisma stoltei]